METLYSKRIHDRVKKIVIVEDEILSSTDMEAYLTSRGFQVVASVMSGDAALEAIERTHPDIVLMDIRIKGDRDGIEIAMEVRARFEIPVVFITAHADRETLERAKPAEPYGYILKPYSEYDLFTTVEMAISKREYELVARARERWFQVVLGQIVDGVIVADSSGDIVYANDAAAGITGAAGDTLYGKKLSVVMGLDDISIDPERRIRSASFAHPRGDALDLEYSVTSLAVDDPDLAGTVFVFRDVTERRRAEENVRNTLAMIRKAMGGTIQAMAGTVEVRDPYTAGHQKRVTDLARSIAEVMALSDAAKDGIRMAGIIHDLGKISVPAEILSKPGRLSEIEYALIKIHPVAGFEILSNIDFPWPVAAIVRQHHERFDGSGYPDGLAGEEILIEARILAVADVVEAMASHRPYRASLGIEAAIQEITRYRGTLFDPEVVDACLRILNDGFSFEKNMVKR